MKAYEGVNVRICLGLLILSHFMPLVFKDLNILGNVSQNRAVNLGGGEIYRIHVTELYTLHYYIIYNA
jgi:hypothetical protein